MHTGFEAKGSNSGEYTGRPELIPFPTPLKQDS
jgi:hypothetical protein